MRGRGRNVRFVALAAAAAFAGAVALVASPGSAQEVPPEPGLEVAVGSLTADGVLVELSCTAPDPFPTQVRLDVSVAQQKGGTPPVTGSGVFYAPCVVGSVVVPVQGAGMLTGGPVTIAVRAIGAYGSDTVQATVDLSGSIDLTVPPPSSGRPITIAPQTTATDDGQAVTGTVHCDSAKYLSIFVSGSQRVGTHGVPIVGGSGQVWCDGTTAFSARIVPLGDGRLAAGPATVTVRATDLTFDHSSASATVQLRAQAPEAPTGTLPPDSPLTFVSAQRTGAGVVVTMSYADCPDGEVLNILAVVSAIDGRGRRVPSAEEEFVSTGAVCDGGDATLTLPAVDISDNRVLVGAAVESSSGTLDTTVWGELAVRR